MRLLSGADGLEDIGAGLIEALGAELGWDGAELWRMAGDERLRRAPPGPRPAAARSLHARRRPARLRGRRRVPRAGVDVARAAVAGRHHRRRRSCAARRRSPTASARRSRCRCAPRACRSASIVLVSRTPREPGAGLVRLLEAIGGHVTQFLQRREAEGRAAEQAEDLRKLSDVAHELAAQSDQSRRAMTLGAPCATYALRRRWCCGSRPAGDELEITAASGAALRGMTASLDVRSVLGEAFQTGEFAFAADVITDPRVELPGRADRRRAPAPGCRSSRTGARSPCSP